MNKYLAIILSSRDIGEFDRMYFLYAREAGLVRVMGKGVRKPQAKLAGHLEPGTHSEIYIARSRGIGQITSAITVDNFEGIKKDFEKISAALDVFKFMARKFAEEEKDESIFDLLSSFLKVLNSAENIKIIEEAFWWKLFDLMGNRPEMKKCLRCEDILKENERKFFSTARGGVICEKCFGREDNILEINSNQIKFLRIILGNPLEKIVKVKIGEGETVGLSRLRNDFEKYNY
ncbi:MAG: DNA repair protein RecO [Candidatus Moranbacteria bacterium]|nr:DNA repair protein RecO [Candidatus Moranbacteria bacterium]